MLRHVSLGLFLAVIWLLFSGHFDPLLLSLGLFSVVLVVLIAWRMDVVDHEGHPVHLTPAAITYFPWLLWEMIKANFDVARRILSREMPISPVCFELESSQKTAVGQVAYANSITLTPGTVTIDIQGSRFTVHALARETMHDLQSGRMDRRVTRMEGG